MAKRRRKSVSQSSSKNSGKIQIRTGRAKDHEELVNDRVHVFVDDQNLFWGIVNDASYGPGFRIDFGKLLIEAAKASDGHTRGVLSAYIAGVIPDDDSFWEAVKSQGFEVLRGFLGSKNRSKQDDAHLITELARTLYEKEGPSTIVLVAGDADYGPPLELALKKGWRIEVAFIAKGVSSALEPFTHEFRIMAPSAIEHLPY